MRTSSRLPSASFWPLRLRAACALLGLLPLGCALDSAGTAPSSAPVAPLDGGGQVSPMPHDGGPVAADGGGLTVADASAQLDGGAPSLDGGPRLDAGAEEPVVRDAGAGEDASLPPLPTCVLAGSYALRADLDVTWTGGRPGVPALLAPGAGTLTFFAAATLEESKRENPRRGADGEVAACGLSVPEFAAGDPSFAGEVYGVDVPDEAWERIPVRWRFEWSASCAQPGCAVESNAVETLLGGPTLRPPGNWWLVGSQSFAGEFDAADDDRDEQRGITFNARGPERPSTRAALYSYPPLGSTLVRASKLLLAVGIRARFAGALESCDALVGTLPMAEVKTQAVGYVAQLAPSDPPLPMLESAVAYLNENLPRWNVTGGRFRAVRVADPSCANVRATLR